MQKNLNFLLVLKLGAVILVAANWRSQARRLIMALSAAVVYTNAPLRSVFDVTVGASNDLGSLAIPHNISFSDVGSASVPNLLTVTLQPMCSLGVALWTIVSINSQSVVLSLMSSGTAMSGGGAGVGGAQLRVEVLRVHSIQG